MTYPTDEERKQKRNEAQTRANKKYQQSEKYKEYKRQYYQKKMAAKNLNK